MKVVKALNMFVTMIMLILTNTAMWGPCVICTDNNHSRTKYFCPSRLELSETA